MQHQTLQNIPTLCSDGSIKTISIPRKEKQDLKDSSFLEQLPEEAVNESILLLVDYESLVSFCSSNEKFSHFLDSVPLWRRLLERDFNVYLYEGDRRKMYEKLHRHANKLINEDIPLQLKSSKTPIDAFYGISYLNRSSTISNVSCEFKDIYERIKHFNNDWEIIKDLFEDDYEKPLFTIKGNKVQFMEYVVYYNGEWTNKERMNTITWELDDENMKNLIVGFILESYPIYDENGKRIV